MKTFQIGDKVKYKRQGKYGSYEAEIIKVSPDQKWVRVKLLSWSGQTITDYSTIRVSMRTINRYNI